MRIIWSTQAQAELFDIAEFYDRIEPDLANEIVSRIEAAVSPLTDFPRLGAIVDALGARKWRVPRTPFILLYDVSNDRIEVLSVSHARKDWASR